MKMTKWQCPVADVGGITELIRKAFLVSPYAPDFNAHHDNRRMIIEVHSYREEGTALVANIGVTTFFHGITQRNLGGFICDKYTTRGYQ